MTIADELGAPELQLLTDTLSDESAALALASVPGGWRTLDADELRALELHEHQVRAVTAMQILVLRSWPSMPRHKLFDAEKVAKVYTPRLAGELDEIVVAVALDADGFFRSEVEVGRNTGKGYGLEAATVLRSMIRAGAEAFVVVMNNPAGKPLVSPDLQHVAERLDAGGEAVGILLVDVVVIGARDAGWISLRTEGIVGASTAVFAEPIILRAEKLWNEKRAARVAAGIDYQDTDETNRMRDELRRYNYLTAQHRVVDASGQRHSTHLARIFSQGSFEKGGRFYRASYQQLTKADRARLTIDGEPVVELDFASMHPTMLYLRAGLEPPEDAYAKDGFERGILKLAFNVALNASTSASACRAVARSLREAGHAEPEPTARQFVEVMPELYPEFEAQLFSGVGLDLQRLDSDIAARVMKSCIDAGIPVLVMHDSFLVRRAHEAKLRRTMTEAFQQVLDTAHPPRIK